MLADKSKAFRADPEVQAALKASGVYELGEPTLAAGESLSDFLADTSTYEKFDVDKAAERDYGFVNLNQLAMKHLIG